MTFSCNLEVERNIIDQPHMPNPHLPRIRYSLYNVLCTIPFDFWVSTLYTSSTTSIDRFRAFLKHHINQLKAQPFHMNTDPQIVDGKCSTTAASHPEQSISTHLYLHLRGQAY